MNRLTVTIAATALAAGALALTPAAAGPSVMTVQTIAPTSTVRGPAFPGFGLNYGRQRFYTTNGPVRGTGHGGWNGHDGHDGGRHHGDWGRRHGGSAFGYGWGYGGDGDGYVDSEPTPDRFGYFGSGGQTGGTGDNPVYHYDRGYPYQWYKGAARERAYKASAPRGYGAPIVHCDTEKVPGGTKGQQVEVRVCRGS
jgi:hypothetical protein